MTQAVPRRLRDLGWPDLADTAAESVLVVPLGATEQHGPHLPFTVDTDIASALAEQLAAARADTVLAPAVPYGSSGEHAGYAGTLSIGQQALETLVVELVRSADAFDGVFLVCGHGGNAAPLGRALRQLLGEGRRTGLWLPSGLPHDSHAGLLETSAVMWLRGDVVRANRSEPGESRPLAQLMPTLRSGGVRSVSPNGVLGDPTEASAEEGRYVLATWLVGLLAAFDEWAAGRQRLPGGSGRAT
ncbi:mycofactocin biosynthesis peptidyl-dipeptidase MftE [Streptomyces viridiviolaceus]